MPTPTTQSPSAIPTNLNPGALAFSPITATPNAARPPPLPRIPLYTAEMHARSLGPSSTTSARLTKRDTAALAHETRIAEEETLVLSLHGQIDGLRAKLARSEAQKKPSQDSTTTEKAELRKEVAELKGLLATRDASEAALQKRLRKEVAKREDLQRTVDDLVNALDRKLNDEEENESGS